MAHNHFVPEELWNHRPGPQFWNKVDKFVSVHGSPVTPEDFEEIEARTVHVQGIIATPTLETRQAHAKSIWHLPAFPTHTERVEEIIATSTLGSEVGLDKRGAARIPCCPSGRPCRFKLPCPLTPLGIPPYRLLGTRTKHAIDIVVTPTPSSEAGLEKRDAANMPCCPDGNSCPYLPPCPDWVLTRHRSSTPGTTVTTHTEPSFEIHAAPTPSSVATQDLPPIPPTMRILPYVVQPYPKGVVEVDPAVTPSPTQPAAPDSPLPARVTDPFPNGMGGCGGRIDRFNPIPWRVETRSAEITAAPSSNDVSYPPVDLEKRSVQVTIPNPDSTTPTPTRTKPFYGTPHFKVIWQGDPGLESKTSNATSAPPPAAAVGAPPTGSAAASAKPEGPRYPEKSRAETWVLRDRHSPYCRARCTAGHSDLKVISIGEYETEDGTPHRFGTIRIKCPPCDKFKVGSVVSPEPVAGGFRTVIKRALETPPAGANVASADETRLQPSETVEKETSTSQVTDKPISSEACKAWSFGFDRLFGSPRSYYRPNGLRLHPPKPKVEYSPTTQIEHPPRPRVGHIQSYGPEVKTLPPWGKQQAGDKTPLWGGRPSGKAQEEAGTRLATDKKPCDETCWLCKLYPKYGLPSICKSPNCECPPAHRTWLPTSQIQHTTSTGTAVKRAASVAPDEGEQVSGDEPRVSEGQPSGEEQKEPGCRCAGTQRLKNQKPACHSMLALLPNGPEQRLLSERHIHYLFRNYNQYLSYDISWAGESKRDPAGSVEPYFDFVDVCQQDVHDCMQPWLTGKVWGKSKAESCLSDLFFGSKEPRVVFALHEQRELAKVEWEYDQPI